MKTPIDGPVLSQSDLKSTTPHKRNSVPTRPDIDPQNLRNEVQKALQEKSARGDFTRILQKAAPSILLSDLPYEVASMILVNQAERFEQFIQTWSDSIEEQAKLDEKAQRRYQHQKQHLKNTTGYLKSTLLVSVDKGKLGGEEAQILLGKLPTRTPVDHDILESGARGASQPIFRNIEKAPSLTAALSEPQSSSALKL
ncbi:MAG: hypothetical protein VYA34_15095 [Myxococcota bacterium]|nr:hypothetical protein [Myxococcota bacterium]